MNFVNNDKKAKHLEFLKEIIVDCIYTTECGF